MYQAPKKMPICPFGGSARQKRHMLRPLAFLVRRLGECAGEDVARIHPFVEQVDGLALARAVDAGDQDQYGKATLLLEVLEVILGIEQRLAQPCFLGPVGGLADAVIEICGFEHEPCRNAWPTD